MSTAARRSIGYNQHRCSGNGSRGASSRSRGVYAEKGSVDCIFIQAKGPCIRFQVTHCTSLQMAKQH